MRSTGPQSAGTPGKIGQFSVSSRLNATRFGAGVFLWRHAGRDRLVELSGEEMTDIATTLHHASTQRRPRDDEIDSYGVTHPGKVRPDNQDHFLIGRLRGRLDIRVSSLPDADRLPIEEERVGSIMMVADGVGGGLKGEKASRIALEEITQYISEAARCYYRDNDGDQDFMHALERAACIVHEKVVEQAAGDPEAEGMATTLTLFIGVWPWTYLLQVGDSRYYRFADGVLSQVSHD